jgi:hypothetical protein
MSSAGCVVIAAKTVALATMSFTLSWTHSVEKTQWQEDWRVTATGLRLVKARVRGSGAGMDPGEGAELVDGWWQWSPSLPDIPALYLAASGATGAGWTLCSGAQCLPIGEEAGAPVIIKPCGG